MAHSFLPPGQLAYLTEVRKTYTLLLKTSQCPFQLSPTKNKTKLHRQGLWLVLLIFSGILHIYTYPVVIVLVFMQLI